MLEKITVSPAPHVSKAHSTRSIMLDVIIGLFPAMVMAVAYFRFRAVIVIGACVVSCVATEWICNLVRKKSNSVDDLSAVVTGIILAFSLPPAAPVWLCVIGSAFAIAIGKMVFGGLGSNTFNPAMASRAFLALSFGTLMTSWTVPATIGEVTVQTDDGTTKQVMAKIAADNEHEDSTVAALTQATPLSWSKQAIKGQAEVRTANEQFMGTLTGQVGGCLGETSAIALLIGGAYLLMKRTITFHIPAAVLLSAAVFAAIGYVAKPEAYMLPLVHLTSGGMLLCALFIATDPVTAPLTSKGMWIFGGGVGVLIMLIRMFGAYDEGVMFAILIMNALTPLIDRFCKLVPAGGKSDG
jgi:electron transport complex protein RnfD